jgi:hypothetical protein
MKVKVKVKVQSKAARRVVFGRRRVGREGAEKISRGKIQKTATRCRLKNGLGKTYMRAPSEKV